MCLCALPQVGVRSKIMGLEIGRSLGDGQHRARTAIHSLKLICLKVVRHSGREMKWNSALKYICFLIHVRFALETLIAVLLSSEG